MAWWQVWWVWVAGGVLVAAAEALLPGYIFLGFASGAVLTGILQLVGLLKGSSISVLLAVFAVLSLLSWIAFRAILGKREGQVKIWDRDINDN